MHRFSRSKSVILILHVLRSQSNFSAFAFSGGILSLYLILLYLSGQRASYYFAYSQGFFTGRWLGETVDGIVWTVATLFPPVLLVVRKLRISSLTPRYRTLLGLAASVIVATIAPIPHDIMIPTAILYLMFSAILPAFTNLAILRRNLVLVIAGLSTVYLPVGITSVIILLAGTVFPAILTQGVLRGIVVSDIQLFYSISQANSALLTGSLLLPVVFSVATIILKPQKTILTDDAPRSVGDGKFGTRRKLYSAIVPGFAVATLLVAFPLKHPQPVGVDAPFYITKMYEIQNGLDIAGLIATEPRALTLLLPWIFPLKLGVSPLTLIPLIPGFLAGALALSAFLFLHEVTCDVAAACIAATFAVFSFQTTVGVAAAIYANWFALSFILLFFYGFYRYTRAHKDRWLLGSMVSLAVVAASHSYSFAVAVATCVFLSVLRLISGHATTAEKRAAIKFVSAVLVLSSIFVIALFPAVSQAKPLLEQVTAGASLTNICCIQSNLSQTTILYVRGNFVAPILFLLAMLGSAVMLRYRTLSEFWLAWALPSTLFTFVQTPFWLWRFLYLIPFFIPLGLGISWISENAPSGSVLRRSLGALLPALLIIVVWNYTLRSIYTVDAPFPVPLVE